MPTPGPEDARAASQAPKPAHDAVEGPESTLEDVRHPTPDADVQADAARREAEAFRERLLAAEGRERELIERLARLQADFENFRRRSREDAAQATGRGKEAVLKALLPTLDNLDRALAHAEDQGLRLVARQLHEGLAGQGITVLDPEGEAFDAKLHEAIAQEARAGVKPGIIVAVAEKGYAVDGRVLRPARVVVAG